MHPNFDPIWLDFDVAVVTLDKPIEDFGDARPVQLVDESHTFRNNEMVTVAGWGLTVSWGEYTAHGT